MIRANAFPYREREDISFHSRCGGKRLDCPKPNSYYCFLRLFSRSRRIETEGGDSLAIVAPMGTNVPQGNLSFERSELFLFRLHASRNHNACVPQKNELVRPSASQGASTPHRLVNVHISFIAQNTKRRKMADTRKSSPRRGQKIGREQPPFA